jgi:hypothetical protein
LTIAFFCRKPAIMSGTTTASAEPSTVCTKTMPPSFWTVSSVSSRSLSAAMSESTNGSRSRLVMPFIATVRDFSACSHTSALVSWRQLPSVGTISGRQADSSARSSANTRRTKMSRSRMEPHLAFHLDSICIWVKSTGRVNLKRERGRHVRV